MKTTLPYIHMGSEFFYQVCKKWEDEYLVRDNISEWYHPSWLIVCKTRYFLEAVKYFWIRSYWRSYGWHNALSERRDSYFLSDSFENVWHIPLHHPGGKYDTVLIWGREMVKSLRLPYWSWWLIWPWLYDFEAFWKIAVMYSLWGVVSGLEPVAQFISVGRWFLNMVMKFHREWNIGTG